MEYKVIAEITPGDLEAALNKAALEGFVLIKNVVHANFNSSGDGVSHCFIAVMEKPFDEVSENED